MKHITITISLIYFAVLVLIYNLKMVILSLYDNVCILKLMKNMNILAPKFWISDKCEDINERYKILNSNKIDKKL